MPSTTKGSRKYNEGNYDRLYATVRKDDIINKAALEVHAADMGESLNAFVNRALREAMERDREKVNE